MQIVLVLCVQVSKYPSLRFLPSPNPPGGESTDLAVNCCHCQFSTEEIFCVKTVDSVLCGFSRGAGTLGKCAAVEILDVISQCCESHKQNSIHLHCFGVADGYLRTSTH